MVAAGWAVPRAGQQQQLVRSWPICDERLIQQQHIRPKRGSRNIPQDLTTFIISEHKKKWCVLNRVHV
jgi:hypothetical protein